LLTRIFGSQLAVLLAALFTATDKAPIDSIIKTLPCMEPLATLPSLTVLVRGEVATWFVGCWAGFGLVVASGGLARRLHLAI